MIYCSTQHSITRNTKPVCLIPSLRQFLSTWFFTAISPFVLVCGAISGAFWACVSIMYVFVECVLCVGVHVEVSAILIFALYELASTFSWPLPNVKDHNTPTLFHRHTNWTASAAAHKVYAEESVVRENWVIMQCRCIALFLYEFEKLQYSESFFILKESEGTIIPPYMHVCTWKGQLETGDGGSAL